MNMDIAGFDRIPVERLLDESTACYLKDAGDPLSQFRIITPDERKANEVHLDEMLKELEEKLTSVLTAGTLSSRDLRELPEKEHSLLKDLITEFLLELDGSRLLFDEPFLAFFIEKGYLEAADAFILRASREETTLGQEEIFQALRNVWIMNSLQLGWSLPLAVTPPVYAYSLLYPYTDNFLDDPAVDPAAKHRFNQVLTLALKGAPVHPTNAQEGKIRSLLAMIEGHYPRADAPQVWQSLLLIQKGQVESLRQGESPLSAEDLLTLSFLKGGASVLADGFLVKGTLTAEEQSFAFSYGAFLQLLDDLQDMVEDRASGHQTLFTLNTSGDMADAGILRLIAFIAACNDPKAGDPDNMRFMKKIISSCTFLMVLSAAAEHPYVLSPDLYHRLESVSKVSLPFYRHLEEELARMLQGFQGALPDSARPGHVRP